jgi:hypothetical protein
MPATTFLAAIKNGKLQFVSFRAWHTFVSQLEGCDIEVTVKKASKAKSSRANRYYWGVVVECCRQGMEALDGNQWSAEEAHELLKQRCNAKELKAGLNVVLVGKTTKGMEADEFIQYIDRCIKWIYDIFGIVVPSSDDVYTEYR